MRQKLSFIVNVIYYALIVCLAYAAIQYVFPIIMPFLLGGGIVLLIRRPSVALARALHWHDKTASIFLLILFYILLFVLAALVWSHFFSGAGNLLSQLPDFYTDQMIPALDAFFTWLRKTVGAIDPSLVTVLDAGFQEMTSFLAQAVSALSSVAFTTLSALLVGMPSLIIDIVLLVVSSFYFAADYARVTGAIWSHLPEKWRHRLQDVQGKLSRSLGIYAKSYTLIFFMTWAELLVGLLILRIPYALPISIAIAVCDIMPILGTGTILIPWTIVSVLLGDYSMAAGIGILYLVITAVRNVVEPKLVGKQIGLHPLLTLISMIVGAHLFGLLGLFGFPVGLSILVQFHDKQGRDDASGPEAASADS